MHHPTYRITHTTAFVTPVVEHWLEREIAQWVHPMKDRSDDPSHHERTLYLWATSRSCLHWICLLLLLKYFKHELNMENEVKWEVTFNYCCFFMKYVISFLSWKVDKREREREIERERERERERFGIIAECSFTHFCIFNVIIASSYA